MLKPVLIYTDTHGHVYSLGLEYKDVLILSCHPLEAIHKYS